MEIATYILFTLGILGATDIALFHSIAHGIRHHPNSRHELILHSLRGPTYAALFILVPNFAMQGLFFWCLVAVFALDLAISIIDFILEEQSRKFIGGLPTGEYVLHILLAMLFGALVTSVLMSAGTLATLPTQFFYAPAAVPWLLRAALALMAVLVLVSGTQDAIAAFKLRNQKQYSEATG